MAVEQYLLGELSGEARDRFEEHLFDCAACTSDLKAGATFMTSARGELAQRRSPATAPAKSSSRWTDWLLRPQLLVPALAACLLLVCFQNFVVLPQLHQQIAQSQTPDILNNIVLAGAVARGASTAEVAAPKHGAFLMSVDIPTESRFTSYRCTLYDPSGSVAWQGDVPPSQANDAVTIRVPVAKTAQGANVLVVQGLLPAQSPGDRLIELARYNFRLKLQD